MAKRMTTEQAFLQIIGDDAYRKSRPVEEQRELASYKSLYNRGKLNLSRIGGFLEKHGYKVVQQELWGKAEAKKGGRK